MRNGNEAALRESQARLAGIVDSAMDAIITVDGRQRITLFNRAAERIFGYESREVLGEPLEKLMPERFRSGHAAHVHHFARTDVSSRPMGHMRIVSALRRNGEEFPIDASISQVATGDERYYTVILRDVTQRVRTEKELAQARDALRELSVASRIAREEENRRISRELHDELGQNLTSLKMDVAFLSENLKAAGPAVTETLEGMLRILATTMAATRRISADLRPLMLDDLGLAAALEWLAEESAKRNGFRVDLQVDDTCARLPEPHASQIYRMVQESLTNAARHARARRVGVSLRLHAGVIALRIEDDGRGLEPADLEKKGSFGLIGIRERVYLLQGTVAIEGKPGGGTRIVASIPAPLAEGGE